MFMCVLLRRCVGGFCGTTRALLFLAEAVCDDASVIRGSARDARVIIDADTIDRGSVGGVALHTCVGVAEGSD